MSNDVFYNYIDWTLETQPRPFYVGKGKYHRIHLRERNVYWKNITAKYGWRREVVLATKDEQFAFEEEKRRIAELGTFENGTPSRWGANLTEGGEGISGRCGKLNTMFGTRLTDVQKEHLRVMNTGLNNPNWGVKGDAHWHTGKPGPNRDRSFSPEWKEKLSAKKRGTRNLNARITYEIACSIRELYATSEFTYKDLASRFNVSKTVIHQVVNSITWKPEHNKIQT